MGTGMSVLSDKNFLFDVMMVDFKCLLHSSVVPSHLAEY